jgi:hypothetical protein
MIKQMKDDMKMVSHIVLGGYPDRNAASRKAAQLPSLTSLETTDKTPPTRDPQDIRSAPVSALQHISPNTPESHGTSHPDIRQDTSHHQTPPRNFLNIRERIFGRNATCNKTLFNLLIKH